MLCILAITHLISILQKTQTKKKMNKKVLDYDYALVSPHYWKHTRTLSTRKEKQTNLKIENKK